MTVDIACKLTNMIKCYTAQIQEMVREFAAWSLAFIQREDKVM